jgi:tetratricopeptide (TPR) repeat protein
MRYALLIGNGAYDAAPLANPINDVRDMGATLQSAGFEVVQKENLNTQAMKAAIQEFGEKMKKNKDAAGFFFFAGHGIQVNGKNYLLPVGRSYKSEQDVEEFAIDTSYILRRLEEANSRISVVILDACRNNPFYLRSARTPYKGLAPMDAPSGSLVAFSTAPGTEASDGSGRNGLYSKHLMANFRIPGLTIEQVFKRTRDSVERESAGAQSPREESSLKGEDFFIIPLDGASFATPTIGNAADIAYWETIKTSTFVNDFKSYIKDFPQGSFVSLAQNRITEFGSKQSELVSRAAPVDPVTLRVGDKTPGFKVTSLAMTELSSNVIANQSMAVFYFFDDGKRCKGCLDTLARLRELADTYRNEGVAVLAFGKMPVDALKKLPVNASDNFHLISADDALLRQFHIADMLPTTIVAAKGGLVTSMVYGSGANNDSVIFSLAESMLARGNAVAAGQMFNSLKGIQSRVSLAQIGNAYSLLKQDRRNEAIAIFALAATDSRKDMSVRGHEGLAEAALAAGDVEKALSESDIAVRLDPNRTAAQMARAKSLLAKGNTKDAEAAIALASSSTAVADFAWQTAEATTARGNLLRKVSPATALNAYQEAASVNPFATDALANQSAMLQTLGNVDKALEVLRQANERVPRDRAVVALLRQAEQASKQKMDLERQRYIDAAVKDLVTQFKEQKRTAPTKPVDDWTSPAMVVSVLDFQTSGDSELIGKVGMDKLLMQEFSQALIDQGITVVDRALLDKLLAELKLGSSELADPDTQLRLGRIMAARLITTASLSGAGQAKALSMRVIDTETTNIAYSTTQREGVQDAVVTASTLASAVVKTVRDKYPLKGRIAVADDDSAIIINLGRKHGVAPGQRFNVLGESTPIELNGKILGYREAKLGQIEITSADELLAYGKALEKTGRWDKNQKIIARATAN